METKTAPISMDDFEAAFLEDALAFYGFKPEQLEGRQRRYTIAQCLLANPASKYRALTLRML